MNCNPDAFHWIINLLRTKTSYEDLIRDQRTRLTNQGQASIKENIKRLQQQQTEEIKDKIASMTSENCLNVLVTSYFLQITWLYEQVWREYFVPNFCEVIN